MCFREATRYSSQERCGPPISTLYTKVKEFSVSVIFMSYTTKMLLVKGLIYGLYVISLIEMLCQVIYLSPHSWYFKVL